jgi:hypothetical protein
MTDSADAFFQRSFIESGSSLEAEVSTKLSEHFEVQNQPVFIDLDEGKSRDGDILAKETFPNLEKDTPTSSNGKHFIAQINLSIECKNLPDHGWVFMQGKMNQNIWHFSLIRGRNGILKNLRPTTPILELTGTTNHMEKILDNKKPGRGERSNSRTDNFYDSSLKVIKLTRHLINADLKEAKIYYKLYNSRRDIIFFKIYQPLIVFNGHLYVKKLDKDRIIPAKFLQISRQYNTLAYNDDATIHVVNSKHFHEYLNIIRPYYMNCSQYIIDHQNEIRDVVTADDKLE